MYGLKSGARDESQSRESCCFRWLLLPPPGRLQLASHPRVNDARLRAEHSRSAATARGAPAAWRRLRPSGVPVVTYPTYRLDSGDRVRIIVFGQDNLSRLYASIPPGASPSR